MKETDLDNKINNDKNSSSNNISTNSLTEELLQNEDEKNNDKGNHYILADEQIGFKNDIYESANIFSKLFFYWGLKILKITSKFKIEASNLGTLDEINDSKYYYKEIYYYWEEKKYKNINNHGLIRAFLRSNVKRIILIFILSLYEAAAEYFQVLLIKGFIDYFDSGKIFLGLPNIKYVGVIFIIIQFVTIFVNLQNSLIEQKIGLRIRYQLNSLVFQKILKISPSSFSHRTSKGKIINFIQNDSYKISELIKYSPI